MKISEDARERVLKQAEERQKEWDKYLEAEAKKMECSECADLREMVQSCNKGNHDLITIYRCDVGYDEEQVVRWCRVCGCIVVDGEYDGRVAPGRAMKMKAPQIYQTQMR